MTVATTVGRAQDLVHAAQRLYADDPSARRRLADCAARLEQPLRVALAGSLKAGKSTLLNALVGQDIAPTDATECTRVVTWYRSGPTPTVTAWYDGDRPANVVVRRNAGRLAFDLGALTADRVDHIDVAWPASDLERTTIIDTPGTSSLSRDVSERTLRLLTPDQGDSGADAVVYLLRTLNASDISFLDRIGSRVGGESGPLGVVGVVSRADEVGAGRIDAMLSARQVADRFAGELEKTGLCQSVVPVAGLLALGARTLRQAEFDCLRRLCALSADEFQVAMLSADRFSRPDVLPDIDAGVRAQLVDRLGMYGIRMGVAMLKMGTPDSPSLAAELLRRSGLDELRDVIDTQFGQRADQLKSHSALLSVRRVLADHPHPDARPITSGVERMLSDTHGFAELRLLGRLRSVDTDLAADELADLIRVIGGDGVDPVRRLGRDPHASASSLREDALSEVRRWRERADHPLLDAFSARACRVAARSAEGVLADLQR